MHRGSRSEHASIQTGTVLVAAIAAYNVVQNLALPAWAYLPVNASAVVVLLLLSPRIGLTRGDLGLRRENLRQGASTGALLAIGVGLVVAVTAALPATRSLLTDDRVSDIGWGIALFHVLVRIPIGTALFEELLFRGVVFGWLRKTAGTSRAIVYSSALFGLWHVLPTLALTASYQGGVIGDTGWAASLGAVLGGVVATGAVGAVFCWLRLRTDSLVAPVIVHAAANTSAYLAAYVIANGV